MERRVILAAGHGGAAPGAQARGHSEHAECIDIVNRTAAKLRADGRIDVVVVPHALDLKAEIRWVNERFGREDGYAAEVHKNAGPQSASGVEAWFLTGSQDAARKAETVLAPLARVSRLRNRGIKKDEDFSLGSLGWLRQTKPRAGLFECGFITHDHFLNDLYAEGLFGGFLQLFDLQETAAQVYRVIRSDGRQIGAFRVRQNAFRAWRGVDGDAVIRNREGRDVTAELVAEFRSLAGPHADEPFEGVADDDFVDIDHASQADEEPPPLEPLDEEEESFEDGLMVPATTLQADEAVVAHADQPDSTTIEPTSIGEIDVEEVGCEEETEATIEGRAEPAAPDVTLTPEENAEVEKLLAEAEGMAPMAAPAGLGPRGGGFGGSENPIKVAMRIGIRNGLTITSLKRSTGSSGSDHHVSQQRSSAADMSNGSRPTPQMDRTAREIATLLGHPEFRAGNLRVTLHGYRVQMLYRTQIGGNHDNHVHVGVRLL